MEDWYNNMYNNIRGLEEKTISDKFDKYISEKECLIATHDAGIVSSYNDLSTLLLFQENATVLNAAFKNFSLWTLIQKINEFISSITDSPDHEQVKKTASYVIEELNKQLKEYPEFNKICPPEELIDLSNAVTLKNYKKTMFNKILENTIKLEYTPELLKLGGIPLTNTNKINYPLLKLEINMKVEYGALSLSNSCIPIRSYSVRTSDVSSKQQLFSSMTMSATNRQNLLNTSMDSRSFIPYYDK